MRRRRPGGIPSPAARSLYEKFTTHTRRITLASFATLSASAALFIAQPVAAAQAKFDPYMQDAIDKTDPFTQGADCQADTYGYLSWKYDCFNPYARGADR